MTEQTYFILASLLEGPMHGYRIVGEAETLSEGTVKLSAGTLYGALERLRETGMIAVDREEIVGGRRRRYFRITAAGAKATSTETERMRAAANAVVPRLATFMPQGEGA